MSSEADVLRGMATVCVGIVALRVVDEIVKRDFSRANVHKWLAYEEVRRRMAKNYGYEFDERGQPQPIRGVWPELKHIYDPLPKSTVGSMHLQEFRPAISPLLRLAQRRLRERQEWRRRRWYEGHEPAPLEEWEI